MRKLILATAALSAMTSLAHAGAWGDWSVDSGAPSLNRDNSPVWNVYVSVEGQRVTSAESGTLTQSTDSGTVEFDNTKNNHADKTYTDVEMSRTKTIGKP